MEIEENKNQIKVGAPTTAPVNGKKFASLNGYTLVKCLGAGFHAKVKLGLNPENGQKVAIKIFKKSHSDTLNLKTLKHEISMMQKLKHQNLVNLLDAIEDATYKKKNGDSYQCIAIVLEYVSGGELFEYVSNTGRFREEVARAYFFQLISGLHHIHERGISHRDLKPENLLFDENFILKIADFGFATLLEGKDGSGLLQTVLGTESYMAPEIHAQTPYSGVAVDLFAATVILFIIFTGGPPFSKADTKDPYYKLLTQNKHDTFWAAHSRGKPKDFFAPEFKDFINRLLACDPTQRLSISEILTHPWMLKNKETQEKMTVEFAKRKAIVDAELEKARLEKLAQKEKQNRKTGANLLYTGAPGFRGPEDATRGEELAERFKNFKNVRTCKTYFGEGKLTDLLTPVDAEYLFEYLIEKSSEFCNDLSLDDKQYKFKCNYVHEDEDLEFKEDISFEIQLVKNEQNDLICVDFKRLEGSSIEYFNTVKQIKELVNSLSLESEVPVTTL